MSKFPLRYGHYTNHPKDHKDIEVNKNIFNYIFDYESELSPNKIKLISNLPFNDTNSKEINVLFSYLNVIYTYG